MGESGQMERRLAAQCGWKINSTYWRQAACARQHFANPDLPEIDDYYEPLILIINTCTPQAIASTNPRLARAR